nr:ribonuclease H-like domain-containing protein [Tanacetum cinerariifolium]
MDDEPIWAADRVVAPTPGSTIPIPETTNEFAIKVNHLTLVKGNQFDGRIKTDPHKHIHEFLKICDMFKYRDTINEVSGKSYDPPINPNDQHNNSKTHINFDSEDEEEESTSQPKSQTPKPIKENGSPICNKHKLEQISSAFLSYESSAMIQNKVLPKLRDPRSFLIPFTFSKGFSCNALADFGASINLMSYTLYYAPLTHSKPQKHMVPTAVLTQSKPVSNTAVRPVSAALPNITVTHPRYAHQGNSQLALQDKGVIDSGCSRHMTRYMSYLSDFEELNGGYVAFEGNPKGGKITGKGKIKTGKIDFDNVYFVKELKFNLFSVSQMCDKKNSVLFTDT